MLSLVPLQKQLIIALVTGFVIGVVLMVLLDDPAHLATAPLGHRFPLGR